MYDYDNESDAAVALELWKRIRKVEAAEDAERRNVPKRADLLGLYMQCLAAVRLGEASPPSGYLN